jgi:hypothetical protein
MRQFSHAIEDVPINSLKPYPRNARCHSKAQIKQIAASIERFGFVNPVLTADDGEIVAGHGRITAAKLLGQAIMRGLTDRFRWCRVSIRHGDHSHGRPKIHQADDRHSV